ncbi:AcrR family transcriptional regulator [Devosia sp. UYZn731]|uniref:TetR/AcrR family transcriptional regulator n=1 Tax=Devosia sp. UYZn731 TaxID=3156345 RepID=UPI003390E4FA
MNSPDIHSPSSTSISIDRRKAVLESALVTFARFGYRKTSMDAVARAARISRPGLYFLFASKEELFRGAVFHALQVDIAEVERILGAADIPIRERLLEAFCQWVGRYIGPMARDIGLVIDDNPDLLGDIVTVMPQRFATLITDAIAASASKADREIGAAVAQTLISTSIGIKYQVETRQDYSDRLALAIRLLLR